MQERTRLVTVGAAAFLCVAIATFPVALVARHLPAGLVLEDAGGSVWHGGASSARLGGTPLGALHWDLQPLALLRGRLAYQLEIVRPDGTVSGRFALTPGGAIEGDDIALNLPLGALDRGPGGWQGGLAGRLDHLRLEHGWPTALTGELTVSDLKQRGMNGTLGSYAVAFDPSAASGGRLVGRVRDVAAPLAVRAQLIVKPERNCSLEGDVTPRPTTPPEVAQALAFLGAPDAAGRRAFVLPCGF